ncbi:MAG: sigma-70 family RNA polymerase sigma factor [Proteobacteria bacterium]|nr:sigma-70 family RNA polymerase sigma factor [Pseudomonadota bacterium]
MAAAQAGDVQAYQDLLEELVPVLRRRVGARLRDASVAEDVVQNALLSIHRARHTYRPERPFGPWMRAIVRNAETDALRQLGRRREREVSGAVLDWFPAPAATAGEEALDPELAAALEGLPDKQREAVELLQVQGLSVAEAALRAGVSPTALKVRAHRGYKRLRERLKGWKP